MEPDELVAPPHLHPDLESLVRPEPGHAYISAVNFRAAVHQQAGR